MQRRSHMAANGSHSDGGDWGSAIHVPVLCDKWLAGMFLLAVVGTGEVLAGQPMSITGDFPKASFNTPPQRAELWLPALSVPTPSVPATFEAAPLPEGEPFSTRDFRPRGRSILEKEPAGRDDVPMLRNTTVWQRLSDFRAHNRVRLLTLWEAGGGSVSLQAGRKGDPSLQWTSRLMNRGGATRGLFDQMFSVSLAGAGRGLHLSPRPAAETSARPAKLLDGANK
jgi:hypothetical protein